MFNALRRRGYTWERALELASQVSGVPDRNIERYRAKKDLHADDETEDILARAAIMTGGWGAELHRLANVYPDLYPLPVDLV